MLKVNCHGRACFCGLGTSLQTNTRTTGRTQKAGSPQPLVPPARAPSPWHQQQPHRSISRGQYGCALKEFCLCKTQSLQIKAFVIVLPRLEKYRYPTTINVKVT